MSAHTGVARGDQQFIETIIREHPELARDRTMLKQFLHYKGRAGDILQAFEYLNLVKSGGMLARLQGVLARFSVPGLAELMFIIDTLCQISAANRYAVKLLGYKAYAYGVTSWAFRHQPPPAPKADLDKLREWISGERRAALGAEEWTKMRDAAITAMTRRCAKHKIQAADMKWIIRHRFRNQPRKLAGAVAAGFQATMTSFESEAYGKLPINYPK